MTNQMDGQQGGGKRTFPPKKNDWWEWKGSQNYPTHRQFHLQWKYFTTARPSEPTPRIIMIVSRNMCTSCHWKLYLAIQQPSQRFTVSYWEVSTERTEVWCCWVLWRGVLHSWTVLVVGFMTELLKVVISTDSIWNYASLHWKFMSLAKEEKACSNGDR